MSRFKHNLSHYKLTSLDMGKLVPIAAVPVLPGDTIQHATSLLLRVSPLATPVMHPVTVRIHHWFVPTRLSWDDAGGANTGFQAFITGGPDGTSTPTVPTITINNAAVGSLADYLDVPTLVASNRSIYAEPFRAYARIYNENYRDEDLTTLLTIDTSDGVDTTTNTTLQSIAWEKDRFTSARLTTQKGTAVTLPLGTSAIVKTSAGAGFTGAQEPVQLLDSTGSALTGNRYLGTNAAGTKFNETTGAATAIGNNLYFSNLYADLSNATAADINDIRWAFAIQKYKEARQLYGSRYTEYLAYLGVRSSDARLQRPEYLGGGKQTIQFSEVLQTGVSTSGTPGTGVGILKGHGIAAVRSNRYRRFFEEHGYIITLLSVRPKTIYGNGIPKHLIKTTKEDWWQKELQHVGQAEIYNKEVYSADTGPDDVFGYNNRYDEYRGEESRVSGEFRTSTLNSWHLARIFSGDVTLNNSFITCDPAESRILQSTSTDSLQVMAYHSIQARRLVDPIGMPNTF